MPKQARLTRIKAFKTYTIEEAAEVSGVSPRTVRNWIRDGLRVMDSSRPALVRGDDLRCHIKLKRIERSVKTQINTFYCLPCKGERRAAAGMADCDVSANRAKLTALCENCGTVVSKAISEASIPDIARTLDLKITRQ